MAAKTKQKCLGCKKNITPNPNGRGRKYCSYECYAKRMAPVWGISKAQAVSLAQVAVARRKAASKIMGG